MDPDLDGAPFEDGADDEDLDGQPLDGAALLKTAFKRMQRHDDIDGIPSMLQIFKEKFLIVFFLKWMTWTVYLWKKTFKHLPKNQQEHSFPANGKQSIPPKLKPKQ